MEPDPALRKLAANARPDALSGAPADALSDGLRASLARAFHAAVEAADPAVVLRPRLPPQPAAGGRLLVVGAGKAAARMAEAVELHYGAAPLQGVVVTPYGHASGAARAGARIAVLEAGHPLPDAAGASATRRLLDLVRGARPPDLLLVLLSGGGSALLTAPAGVTLRQKADLTRRLLESGATVSEINVVRKHLSGVKGGRLAALSAAPVLTLAISDVVGDDPASIASGPTVPDPSTYEQALAVVERYAPDLATVRSVLERGVAGELPESPKPGDPRFTRAGFEARYELVASARLSLTAAARALEAAGCEVRSLGEVTGEARVVGREHAALARSLLAGRGAGAPPLALLSGGEVTVTLRPATADREGPGAAPGRGGPNGEYALGFAEGFAAAGAAGGPPARCALLAADSDGIDGGMARVGPGAAGALLGPEQLAALTPARIAEALARHDSHGLLERVGGLFVTGPTRTNVNDVRIVVLMPVAP